MAINTTEVKKRRFRWLPADPDWHPDVAGLYNALKKSEHYDEFQETDMRLARLIAQEHSDSIYNSVEKNAALLKLIFEQWKEFGVTMGSRRRLQVEVEKVEEQRNTGELLSKMAHAVITGKPINE